MSKDAVCKAELEERIAELEAEASAALEKAAEEERLPDRLRLLEEARVRFLGKSSPFSQLGAGIRSLPIIDDRRDVGKRSTELRRWIEGEIERGKEEARRLESARRLEEERLDITLPGRARAFGSEHPISQTIRRVARVFQNLGFEAVEGPEVETEYYNFDALNVPKNHPARDMMDTIYLKPRENGLLLRTHMSAIQARYMEKHKPPLRIIAPGRAYRQDNVDATHMPMFYQLDGLAVGEGMRFSDLKGVLELFAAEMFGSGVKTRLRPGFFPFTEPSAEMDASCQRCGGDDSRCGVCKGTGWMEILGAGMVHPAVFEAVGYDPERYTGFAFGIGINRIAMILYRIDDIRLLYQNDMRLLNQF